MPLSGHWRVAAWDQHEVPIAAMTFTHWKDLMEWIQSQSDLREAALEIRISYIYGEISRR